MKLATFFRSSTIQNFTKLLGASEETIKSKLMLQCTFLLILHTSGVMVK